MCVKQCFLTIRKKLNCIITRYETWMYAYDPETTDQSSVFRAKGRTRPKEHVKVVQKSRSFSIFIVWCATNSFHPAKLLIRFIIIYITIIIYNSSKKTGLMGQQLLVFASALVLFSITATAR